MKSTRLFILGALARYGPMHGHQIRRNAQTDRADLWADVKVGSLYAALHRMAAEGAIEVVRSEQEGNRPARTVYAITPQGRLELAAIRDRALRDAQLRPDPVDLALQITHGLDEDAIREMLQSRRDALASQLASWQRLRREADPSLTLVERLAFGHTLRRLETEVAWHDELLQHLPGFSAQGDTP